MFLGLFESQLFMRLPDRLRAATERQAGLLRHLEPMPGRPMKEYFVLPGSFLANEKSLATLIGEAAAHGAENGVRALAAAAMREGATKEEIAETLRVTCQLTGAGCLSMASAGLKGLFEHDRGS